MMTMELFWVAVVAGSSGAIIAFVTIGVVALLSKYL